MSNDEHDWFEDHAAAYAMGGLSADERERVERHAAECAACAEKLNALSEMDRTMNNLFASVRPGSDFEQGIIDRLERPMRLAGRVRWASGNLNPLVRRAAVAAAAAIVLGGLGYVANSVINEGRWPTVAFDSSRVRVASNLSQLGQAVLLYSGNTAGLRPYPSRASGAPASPAEVAKSLDARWQSVANSGADDRSLSMNVEPKKWDYGGGTNTAAGWQNSSAWTVNTSSSAHQMPGQNVVFGDGHTEFERNASNGVQRDGVYTQYRGNTLARADVTNSPGDGNDSILLPTEGDEKGATSSLKASAGTATVVGGVLRLDQAGIVSAGTSVPSPQYFQPEAGGATKPGENLVAQAAGSGGWRGEPQFSNAIGSTLGSAAGGAMAGDSDGDGIADLGVLNKRDPRAAAAFDALREKQLVDAAKSASDASVADSPRTPSVPPSAQIPAAAPPLPTTRPSGLKVIRNGTMQFVVDSFDSALLQITAIVNEEGGYVGTTNSQKLPNGKVEGTITIRVKPENLDVLVLKLRALGELKDQKISSEDVTKEYTDLGSELRAARAMEERLLDLIKNGKGAIKDLLAAEKELGEWRGKIEQITGQMNYYDSLVAMSTLEITLSEKDIKTPALASQSETVDMGVETEDVEKARTEALSAIDEVKGRIVESELKQMDAGQMAGKIVADIAFDKAGPVIDQLKQLGTVSRLEVQRAEVTTDGHGNAVDADTLPQGLRVEQKDTRLTLSLYNLANVAPRQTANVELACDDVEASYHAILDRVAKAGGRVISSNLSRPTADQVTGSMNFEIKSADADGVLMDVKAAGAVMLANTTENPDTNNVTASKRGFSVQLRSIQSVNPRQTVNVELACDDVDASYHAILDQVGKAGGRVVSSSLSRPTPDQVTGTMSFEVKSADADGVLMELKAAGDVMQSSTAENQDPNNVTATKRGFIVQLRQLASVNPREVRTVGIATGDVTAAYEKLLASVQNLKARIVVSKLDNEQDASGNQQNETAGWLDFEVKRGQIDAVEKALADAGDSVQRQVLRSNDDQNTLDTKVQFKVGLHNATLLPPRESWTLAVESGDVDGAQADVLWAMSTAGGRVVDSTLSKEANGKTTGHLVIDVPLDQAAVVVDRVKHEGEVRVVQSTKNPQATEGKLAKARLDITIGSPEAIVSGDRGLWSTVRAGLTTSVTVLLWSLQLVVTGVCLVGPFAAVIWGGWWVVKRRKAV